MLISSRYKKSCSLQDGSGGEGEEQRLSDIRKKREEIEEWREERVRGEATE